MILHGNYILPADKAEATSLRWHDGPYWVNFNLWRRKSEGMTPNPPCCSTTTLVRYYFGSLAKKEAGNEVRSRSCFTLARCFTGHGD